MSGHVLGELLRKPRMRLGTRVYTGGIQLNPTVLLTIYQFHSTSLLLYYEGRSIQPCSILRNVASYLYITWLPTSPSVSTVDRQSDDDGQQQTTRRSNVSQKFTHTFISPIPPEIYISRQYISGIHFSGHSPQTIPSSERIPTTIPCTTNYVPYLPAWKSGTNLTRGRQEQQKLCHSNIPPMHDYYLTTLFSSSQNCPFRFMSSCRNSLIAQPSFSSYFPLIFTPYGSQYLQGKFHNFFLSLRN